MEALGTDMSDQVKASTALSVKKAPPGFAPKVYSIDRHRAEERVGAHFAGQAKYMLDYLRCCVSVSEVDSFRRLLELRIGDHLPGANGLSGSPRIVGIENRFESPAHSGYMDLRFNVLLKESHVCTVRFVPTGLFEAQKTLLVTAADLNALAARRQLQRTDAWFVVIADNFNHDADTGHTLIYGFPLRSLFRSSLGSQYSVRLLGRCAIGQEAA